MSENRDQAAIKATTELITNDDAFAIGTPLGRILPDELIVEPNPADYVPPSYLQKTAPRLASAFGELLRLLWDLNARFAGERTVEVQAMLSLTGEHEWLEEKFLGWCQMYFKIRGSRDRLNPKNGHDPWRLYMDCYEEFGRLLERRIVQPGTINSSVLNLSQRFMLSAFAGTVLGPDPTNDGSTRPDRFSSAENRYRASCLVNGYRREVDAFSVFLEQVAQHLPPAYSPNDSSEWLASTCSKVARCGEDLALLRSVLCVLKFEEDDVQQLLPDLWARFTWDVYHGCSVASVLTSSSPEPSAERVTKHLLAFRRDGWLCHREYPWLRVQPDYLPGDRKSELAVSWYLLDTLTAPLYESWDALDRESVVARGLEAEATDEEQTAAIAAAMPDTEAVETEPIVRKKARVPRMWLSEFEKLTTSQFGCEWSQAKGSERKVFRHGGKQFVFGCHAADHVIYPVHISRCLKALRIPLADFVAACR